MIVKTHKEGILKRSGQAPKLKGRTAGVGTDDLLAFLTPHHRGVDVFRQASGVDGEELAHRKGVRASASPCDLNDATVDAKVEHPLQVLKSSDLAESRLNYCAAPTFDCHADWRTTASIWSTTTHHCSAGGRTE